MIPNEYLYYFYYAADTVNAIRSAEPARGLPARAAARVLRPLGRRRAGRLARDPPRPRAHLHGRGAQRGRRRVRARPRRQRRLRERGDGGAGGDRAQQPPGPDPQHRQPLQPAVPGRARGGRGPVRGRPRRPGAAGDRPGPGARARAGGDDEGRGADHDRRRAARLPRTRGQGARAAPAGALGRRRRARSSTATASGCRRCRRPSRDGPVDIACAEPAFLDLTMAGLDALPGPGEERLATDFLRSPGGGAITAVGAARLGLSCALVSPLGDDAVGHPAALAARRRRRALERAARRALARDRDHAARAATARWRPSTRGRA